MACQAEPERLLPRRRSKEDPLDAPTHVTTHAQQVRPLLLIFGHAVLSRRRKETSRNRRGRQSVLLACTLAEAADAPALS
jgi:hypothetical protein